MRKSPLGIAVPGLICDGSNNHRNVQSGLSLSAANKKFEEWLGDLWFRPNDLKRMAKLQEMGGVYIPFWTFDAWVRSDWTADAGYHYYETEYYTDAEGNSQSRQVQHTRWEFASGWRQRGIKHGQMWR